LNAVEFQIDHKQHEEGSHTIQTPSAQQKIVAEVPSGVTCTFIASGHPFTENEYLIIFHDFSEILSECVVHGVNVDICIDSIDLLMRNVLAFKFKQCSLCTDMLIPSLQRMLGLNGNDPYKFDDFFQFEGGRLCLQAKSSSETQYRM
jgi:hypothetical protein